MVGTGSSRKSATNSVLWFTGEDIPFVPNSVSAVSAWAPRRLIFNTMEDAAALPIEIDAGQMDMATRSGTEDRLATGRSLPPRMALFIAESQLKTSSSRRSPRWRPHSAGSSAVV